MSESNSTTGSKYVVETGDGYEGIWRVSASNLIVSIQSLSCVDWKQGETVDVAETSSGVVVGSSSAGDRLGDVEVGITSYSSTGSGGRLDVQLPIRYLASIGAGPGDDVRVYEHESGILLVDPDDDPKLERGGSR